MGVGSVYDAPRLFRGIFVRIVIIKVFTGLTNVRLLCIMFLTGGQWKGHAQPRKGVRASVQRVISLTTYFYKVLTGGGETGGR